MDSTLFIKLDASGASRDADRLSRSLNKVEQSGDKTSRSVSALNARVLGLASAVGAVAFGAFTKGAIDAGREFQRLNRLLSESDLQFVRDESDRLGLSLSTSANGFAKLSAAAAGTSLEGQKARDIFIGVSTAVAGLGLSSEQANGALVAIEQIISKGTVSAEELRGQLGERIPGAFQIAARSIGLTTEALGKQLELGNVMADDFLPKFAAELEKTYSGAALTGAQELTAEQNRLSNAFLELQKATSDGFLDSLTNSVRSLTSAISSEGAISAAQGLGGAVAFLIDNIDALALAGGAFAAYKTLPAVFSSITTAVTAFNTSLVTTQTVTTKATAAAGLMGVGVTKVTTQVVALTGAQKAMAVATRASSAALALVGGPVGALAIAAVGLVAYSRNVQAAILENDKYSDSSRSVIESLVEQEKAQSQLSFAGSTTTTAIIALSSQLSDVDQAIEENRLKTELWNSELNRIKATQGGLTEIFGANSERINQLNVNISKAGENAQLLANRSGVLSRQLDELNASSGDASESINRFEVETQKYGDQVAKILKADRDRLALTKQLQKAISGGADETGALQKRLDQLNKTSKAVTKSFGGYGSAVKQVASFLDDYNKDQKEQAALIDEINRLFPEAQRNTDAYSDALRRAGVSTKELNDDTDDLADAFGGYGTAAKQAAGIVDEFNTSQKEQAAVLEEINKIFPETERNTDAYKAAVREAGIETEKTTTVMSESWERFKDASFDALQTFYRDGLDGAKSFGDSIKDLFKDMVANILAQLTSLVASNAFKSLIGFITGKPSEGGLFDGIGSIFGLGSDSNSSPQGGSDLISSALSALGVSPSNIATSVASSLGLIGSSSSAAAAAAGSVGGAGIGGAGIGGGIAGGSAAGSAAPTASAFGSQFAAVAGPVIAAAISIAVGRKLTEDITGNTGRVLGTVGGIAGGLVARALDSLGIIGNARTKQELAEDQLGAVNQAISEGRTERVDLGQAGGVDVGFRGGFDENSVFFDIGGSPEIQQQVAELLVKNFGFDQARVVEDGILRLEDFSREYSQNNEDIVAEVKASLVEVQLSITDLEKNTLGSLGSTLIEIDSLFDATAGNGQTTADRIALAYSQAFNTTIEAGKEWVNQSGIDADRIGQIFEASSDLVTQNLFGITEDGTDALAQLGDFAEDQANRIGSSFNGLNGILNDIDLGNLKDIQLPVVAVQPSQGNSVQNSSNQQVTIDPQVSESLIALSSEIAETNRELRNQRLSPTNGR